MILPGRECCDKWEGWMYNDEGTGEKRTDVDYTIAHHSMQHEAELMRSHPSILGLLIGSDCWPNDLATLEYRVALLEMDWDTPIVSSASQRGHSQALGNGGMKMEDSYGWVPPSHWWDGLQRLGSAGDFGSELGSGVDTSEIDSLKRFLSDEDLKGL